MTSEHILLALLEDPESDVNVILERFHVEGSRIRTSLTRMLAEQRTGHAGRPVFSPILLEWIQDAWLYASTELGDGRVRSGALLVRLVQAPTRYLATNLPGLDEIPRDDLRKNLTLWAVQSGEAATTPRAQDAEPGGPAPTSAGDRALQPFTTNQTERAAKGELYPVIGRESRGAARCWISSAGAGRTTRSSSASRSSGRGRSSKGSPSGSTKRTSPPSSATCSSSSSTSALSRPAPG